ncbi:hypothetical protein KAFR_0K02570 [Kazachstania africana CBS 2517]|uniref:Uncharacterized protein n=1 Tax=Kazachstania africana (strain ATCC 22294 / BCRC 22015 / CBS 2517 / CECT 1963 / NBRC 1671 / NRRL Y-8276) TaxID=1071382 RepID=H2B1W3_KAZAF|nr:hypothetical protein KAFR_0K02570 [Kazachstania africana CBS 2517]CCF60613.1 hypothetical protein KAFR_0K02570 [Kazachstania africana CBS 2517]
MCAMKVSLYGGAITSVIPEGFLDASMLREVPDTQEVFVNSRKENESFVDGLGMNESIVVDLLQRVDAVNDDAALKVHIEEIASLNDAQEGFQVLKHDKINGNSQSCIIVESALKWGKQDLKESVLICVGLIRLKDVDTDALITINVPLTQQETGLKSETLPSRALAAYSLLHDMIKQFKVIDNSLFMQ